MQCIIGASCNGASWSEQYFWRIRQYYVWRAVAVLLSPPASRCWKPAESCRSWLTGADSLWYVKCVKSLQGMGKAHRAEECGIWGLCRKLPGTTNFGWKGIFRYFFVIIKMPDPGNPLTCKCYRSDCQLMCGGTFVVCSLWHLGSKAVGYGKIPSLLCGYEC